MITSNPLRLVLGTKNPGKLKEFFELCGKDFKLELVLAPPGFDPEESGQTFAENALIKARACAEMTGCLSLGEDSGISVAALNGRPGVYSARYCAGDDGDRRRKLLSELSAVPDGERDAHYSCAMALVSGKGELLHQSFAIWKGEIAHRESGENGFGYDPIFYLPSVGMTSAQISRAQKNELSHRAAAWQDMENFLVTMPVQIRN
jgi:XTP/dITP diphosphohydrolase